MRTRALIRTVLGAAAAASLAACNTEIVVTEDRHPGYLEIRPVDTAGACVLGVRLDFTSPGRALPAGVNAYNCAYIAGGPPGEWSVKITPPAGYTLAPGQDSLVRATVTKDRTTLVSPRLAPAAP